MKYGENLAQISVAKWNIHNVDYNSLKHLIKVNTRRDQAKAVAIPGQPDVALLRFESLLYDALCQEHDRVNLFVLTQASELSRHLQHLTTQVHRLVLRCTQSDRPSIKRQARLVHYEQELLAIGDDLKCLPRFIHAQAEAFRKLTKKYRKWTGSSSLGDRFKFEVLGDPKSFSHHDFTDLREKYKNLLSDLRSIAPQSPLTSAASTPRQNSHPTTSRRESVAWKDQPPPPPTPSYWNEYEHGSEAGDDDDGGYAIYINPDEDDNFLPEGMVNFFTKPVTTIQAWFGYRPPPNPHGDEEDARRPLLRHAETSTGSYGTVAPSLDSDDDDEYDEYDGGSSSAEDFPGGYNIRSAALPSLNDQRLDRYRNTIRFRTTLASFCAAIVLLIVASTLISTGRHKLMAEVDSGVIVGGVATMMCAGVGLCTFLLRTDRVGWVETVAVWFIATGLFCGSGALMVLVVGRLD